MCATRRLLMALVPAVVLILGPLFLPVLCLPSLLPVVVLVAVVPQLAVETRRALAGQAAGEGHGLHRGAGGAVCRRLASCFCISELQRVILNVDSTHGYNKTLS
jgi:hypothetical protein